MYTGTTNLNKTQPSYLPLHRQNAILCTENVFRKCYVDFAMVPMTVLTVIEEYIGNDKSVADITGFVRFNSGSPESTINITV